MTFTRLSGASLAVAPPPVVEGPLGRASSPQCDRGGGLACRRWRRPSRRPAAVQLNSLFTRARSHQRRDASPGGSMPPPDLQSDHSAAHSTVLRRPCRRRGSAPSPHSHGASSDGLLGAPARAPPHLSASDCSGSMYVMTRRYVLFEGNQRIKAFF